MKKKIRIVIESICIISLVFLYAHIAKTHNVYDNDIDPSQYGSVVEKESVWVEEYFKVDEETLNGVRVKGAESGDISKVNIEYVLKEADTGKELASGKVNAKKALKSRFYELPFEEIKNCKGKQYILALRESSTDNESAVYFSFEKKVEPNTKFVVNNNNIEGTLILKTITNRFDMETFFVVMIFVLYIILFLKILYKLFK